MAEASFNLGLAFLWLLFAQVVICAQEDSIIQADHSEARSNRTVPFQVIGAGMAKTGTTSLHYALEILGIQPVHDAPNLGSPSCPVDLWSQQIILKKQGKYNTEDGIWDTAEQWDQILGSYAAIVDAPGHMFVAELARAYPEAKVILTIRDSPETWEQSYRNSIYDRNMRQRRSFSFRIMSLLRRVFKAEGNQAKVRRALMHNDNGEIKEPQRWWYTQHLEHVRRHVPSERLLEYNVKEGWGPLCEFLGKDVPDTPFPHANSRDEFQRVTSDAIDKAEQDFKFLLQLIVGSAVALVLAYTLYR